MFSCILDGICIAFVLIDSDFVCRTAAILALASWYRFIILEILFEGFCCVASISFADTMLSVL